MRMNDTMLGYLNSHEIVRRQAENPYIALNQMADMAKISRMQALKKDTVPETRNSDEISIRRQDTREKERIKKEEREKNNGPEVNLFYNSSGTGVSFVQNSTFEFFV